MNSKNLEPLSVLKNEDFEIFNELLVYYNLYVKMNSELDPNLSFMAFRKKLSNK